jgi:hypothetical protein
MNPPYFLLEDGQPTGPHSLPVLHQKAEIRVITPDSCVRPVGGPDTPWLPIRALPDLHALLFPPRAAPMLAANRPIAATNPPIDTATHPVAVERMLQDNTSRLAASEHFDPGHHGPSPRSRRHRSFLLTALAFAAPAWAIYHYGLVPQNQLTLVVLVSLVAFATLLAWWFIYHVSDFRS